MSVPDSPNHPAHESKSMVFRYGYTPVIIAVAVLGISVVADLLKPCDHWTQRSGSIVTVLGVFVGFIDAKRSAKVIPLTADATHYFLNPNLPYKFISIALAGVGTITWGYADLWL